MTVRKRYVGPFEIIEKIGKVAYKLNLPAELGAVHNVFHVSNLKKCLSDETLIVPFKELTIDERLQFVEEPVEITDQDVRSSNTRESLLFEFVGTPDVAQSTPGNAKIR